MSWWDYHNSTRAWPNRFITFTIVTSLDLNQNLNQWNPFLRGHPDERPTPLEITLDNVNLNVNLLISTPDKRPPLLKGHTFLLQKRWRHKRGFTVFLYIFRSTIISDITAGPQPGPGTAQDGRPASSSSSASAAAFTHPHHHQEQQQQQQHGVSPLNSLPAQQPFINSSQPHQQAHAPETLPAVGNSHSHNAHNHRGEHPPSNSSHGNAINSHGAADASVTIIKQEQRRSPACVRDLIHSAIERNLAQDLSTRSRGLTYIESTFMS